VISVLTTAFFVSWATTLSASDQQIEGLAYLVEY
jgi:hypothetical protein